MIYTVTFNPAIDYYMQISSLNEGETNRSGSEYIEFGGKGINVSLILAQLGVSSAALGFIAGFTGEALREYMEKSGVKAEFIRLKEGSTRINVKLKGESITEINADGPKIDNDALEALICRLNNLTADDTLVLAGSVPKSMPQDIYEKILERAAEKGVKCVVDATDKLLLNVLKFEPFLIKPNHRELEQLAGRELETDEDIISAAKELKQKGARNVLVSLGARGAILLDENGGIHKGKALGGKPVNTVGAGDSMVAGFLAGASKGYGYALQLGLAAGGATACSRGLAVKEDIMKLMQ